MPQQQTFRNISDTAIWAAIYRARETRRPDGLFRDPFAQRLAGARGERIAEAMRAHDRQEWAWIMRTVLFDQFIEQQVSQGVDLVLNLAAGLDARPYRMSLAPQLQWIEVDLPDLVGEKEALLAGEKPLCRLERVGLDLADVSARRRLFADLEGRAARILVLTEGLLIYWTQTEVASLADDLALGNAFRFWVLDLASPGLLRLLQRRVGADLNQAGAPLRFGPREGPEFFAPHRWKSITVRSVFQEAARRRRIPLWMRLLAKLPESSGRQGPRIWSGICLLEKP